MDYSTIQPPFTLKFREMSKKDLRAYAEWFHSIMPSRIAILGQVVRSTHGFETWEPDEAPDSLDLLGKWFEGQVQTRQCSPEEIAQTASQLRFPIDIPKWELTNRTFSLAIDIGMYFGKVVLKHVDGARWDQPMGSKNFADYGQPVLIGLGNDSLNPVGVITNVAYAIADGQPANLRKLFDTWTKDKKQEMGAVPRASRRSSTGRNNR